jgi:hypothetical protein
MARSRASERAKTGSKASLDLGPIDGMPGVHIEQVKLDGRMLAGLINHRVLRG